jgi:hypothetical protein
VDFYTPNAGEKSTGGVEYRSGFEVDDGVVKADMFNVFYFFRLSDLILL